MALLQDRWRPAPVSWSDMLEAIRETNAKWERFARSGNPEGLDVRPEILQSWERCYRAGTDASRREAPTVLRDADLQRERARHRDLIEAAAPLLKELGLILDGTGQLITLCDSASRVLEVVGDRSARRTAGRINLLPGADWSEAVSGTNAMGTALAQRQPVIVFATEHYCEGPKDWACAAAPILSPSTGEPLGVLDLSGRHTVLNRHSLGMIVAAARSIEGRLHEQYLQRRSALLVAYAGALQRRSADLTLAVDAEGVVIDATPRVHPLLRDTGSRLVPEPALGAALRRALADPRAARTWVESIEPPAGPPYTVTYSPVFKGDRLCGLLLFAHGPARGAGARPRAPLAPGDPPSGARHSGAGPRDPFAALVGRAPALLRAVEIARRAAPASSPVLILGETGVGKEVLARAIHAASPRAGGPFVAVNCGGIPRDLLASELFGYAPGAFTGATPRGKPGKFEAASGGTLFLDEIGELPPEAQTYLLRVLQEKEVVRLGSHVPVPVDARVVAATNRDLRQMVARGRFREDLYYRLNVVEIHLPPLRERPEDLPLLIRHLLASHGIHDVPLEARLLEQLRQYAWPGNVRELRNVLERAVILGLDVGEALSEYVSAPRPAEFRPGAVAFPDHTRGADPPAAGARVRHRLPGADDPIIRALLDAGGNVSQAARQLRVARSTVYRHLRARGLHLNRNLTADP